ncbi:MAG TPA: hypothetical protein DDY68_01515 [Porphyromonadaceae bacterium]|nr:hypothetical protein [Porphyromonadaceae bacterium]
MSISQKGMDLRPYPEDIYYCSSLLDVSKCSEFEKQKEEHFSKRLSHKHGVLCMILPLIFSRELDFSRCF